MRLNERRRVVGPGVLWQRDGRAAKCVTIKHVKCLLAPRTNPNLNGRAAGKSASSDCISRSAPARISFCFCVRRPSAILGPVNCGARRKKNTLGITVNGFSRLKMQSERNFIYKRPLKEKRALSLLVLPCRSFKLDFQSETSTSRSSGKGGCLCYCVCNFPSHQQRQPEKELHSHRRPLN